VQIDMNKTPHSKGLTRYTVPILIFCAAIFFILAATSDGRTEIVGVIAGIASILAALIQWRVDVARRR